MLAVNRPRLRYAEGPSHHGRGFTMIELLVVVAVVVILASLILGAFVSARRKAQRAECAHNLGQIQHGLQLFVGDNNTYPLAVNVDYSKGGNAENETAWSTALQSVMAHGDPVHYGTDNPYARGVWLCPSGSRPAAFPQGMGYNSYGYNAWGICNGPKAGTTSLGLGGHNRWQGTNAAAPPIKESEVASPSQMVAVGDSFLGGKSVIVDGRWFIGRNGGMQDYFGSTVRSRDRHQGKANITFCDGHVELLSFDALFVDEGTTALSRWNRDNQPHAEMIQP